MTVGTVIFKSSDKFLEERFQWAKEMALSYAHQGEDKVGLWYEAALPERDSFCIRDVSHQIHGATYLGLDGHSKNMLEKFVANISPARDYCTFWEIDKENRPTAVDYTNDQDFWYVLLANFELIVACYQQYCYTGDLELINGLAFDHFFQLTLKEYSNQWDLDNDGILEHYDSYGRRGLASYNEVDTSVLQGGDMLAVQHAAYLAYSKIMLINGNQEQATLYQEKATQLQNHYLTEWFNPKTETFYGAKQEDGSFYPDYYEEGNFLPIYFQLFKADSQLEQAIGQLKANPVKNVEGLTYMAQTFYHYDKVADGWNYLQQLMAPELERNDYPEVSYSIIANYVSGIMGLKVTDYLRFEIRNNCQIEAVTEIEKLPLFNGYVMVRYASKKQVEIQYIGSESPICKVTFEGDYQQCQVDDETIEMTNGTDRNGQNLSQIELSLGTDQVYRISV